MSGYSCQTCGASFDVPQQAVDKYPGWTPRFCREHSPKRKAAGARGRKGAGRKRGGAQREERLTPAGVLAKYTGGPTSGVFTDGSSIPNPGPGGWGVVWVRDGAIQAERCGHDPATTNNRMELTALVEAFRLLPEDAKETVLTDSRLCVDTIESWAPKWERAGWKKKTGPIKNLPLVQELLELRRAHAGCKLVWIAAHSGHRWNEYADSLSTSWIQKSR